LNLNELKKLLESVSETDKFYIMLRIERGDNSMTVDLSTMKPLAVIGVLEVQKLNWIGKHNQSDIIKQV
jgi:hypothetical protein